MNTRKFTGDMSSQVEADRDQLVEMREVLSWADKNVVQCDHPYDDTRWRVTDARRHYYAPTLYSALHAAWSNRGKT